jgi:glycosyltransferase involved in cell wall biosynthesis
VRIRPHIIHLNQGGFARIVIGVARVLNVPVICHVRLNEDALMLRRRIRGRWCPAAYIAISESVRGLLESGANPCAAPHGVVATIYDPIRFAVGTPSTRAEDRRTFRAALDIGQSSKLVVIVGRVCEEKGQDVVVRAMKLLNNASARCVIVGGEAPHAGSGPSFRERLGAVIEQCDLAEQIVLLGMRDDIPSILSAADVLVVASSAEPFGRVLLEALLSDVPVIATHAGGAREIIGNDERGLTFPVGDAQALASRLAETFEYPAEAVQRTALGRAWVLDVCDPAKHARLVERLYDTVTV